MERRGLARYQARRSIIKGEPDDELHSAAAQRGPPRTAEASVDDELDSEARARDEREQQVEVVHGRVLNLVLNRLAHRLAALDRGARVDFHPDRRRAGIGRPLDGIGHGACL